VAPIPRIPDREIMPGACPGHLKEIKTILAIKAHLIIGQVNFLFILGGPGFKNFVSPWISKNNNIQGFALFGVVGAH